MIVSDLRDRLSYSEIISVITRYTEVPPKLLNLVEGNRNLVSNDILDLKFENFINAYVKGFGGGKVALQILTQMRNTTAKNVAFVLVKVLDFFT